MPAALAVAAVIVLGAVAWARIPDSAGVVHACYATSTGALRVIDTATSSQQCTSIEKPLTWNQSGINWRGTWSASSTYAQGDAVAYAGSSYPALAGNANVARPGHTSTWVATPPSSSRRRRSGQLGGWRRPKPVVHLGG